MRSSGVLFLVALLAGSAYAAVPSAELRPVECITRDDVTVVEAAVNPIGDDLETRLYFRREGYGDFYWVPMTPYPEDDERQTGDEPGMPTVLWGIVPIPEPDNASAELYVSVFRRAEDDPSNDLVVCPEELVAQSEVTRIPVLDRDDCPVELDQEQGEVAEELSVGETAYGQKWRKVAWWRCEGVTSRVDLACELRADEACRAGGLLWWDTPWYFVPLGGAGVVGVIIADDDDGVTPEISPSVP